MINDDDEYHDEFHDEFHDEYHDDFNVILLITLEIQFDQHQIQEISFFKQNLACIFNSYSNNFLIFMFLIFRIELKILLILLLFPQIFSYIFIQALL